MKSVIAGLLLICWWGCAPLTPPERSESTSSAEDEEKDSALARYLQERRTSADSVAVSPPYIAALPFADRSGFRRDIWDLEGEMARLLSAYLAAAPYWQVVPYRAVAEAVGEAGDLEPEKALEIGRLLQADMIVLGVVRDYDMRRVAVGDPLLGGYKSYTGIADLELRVVGVRDQREIGTVETTRETVDRDLGLDLLGKPRQQDIQFTGLRDMVFGSEEFESTALGQATFEAMDDLVTKLGELVRPSGLKLGGQPAEILSIYEEEIFINIGSENRVRTGYRFEVYPGPRRALDEGLDTLQPLGVIEVQEIIGARLSRVWILEGEDQIRTGDRLRLMKSEP